MCERHACPPYDVSYRHLYYGWHVWDPSRWEEWGERRRGVVGFKYGTPVAADMKTSFSPSFTSDETPIHLSSGSHGRLRLHSLESFRSSRPSSCTCQMDSHKRCSRPKTKRNLLNNKEEIVNFKTDVLYRTIYIIQKQSIFIPTPFPPLPTNLMRLWHFDGCKLARISYASDFDGTTLFLETLPLAWFQINECADSNWHGHFQGVDFWS